jgi:YfdX protein
MKRHTLKNTTAAVVIALTASMGSAMSVSAADTKPTISSSSAKSKESLSIKRKLLEERQQKVEHEALEAITGTQNALMALQKKDTKKAIALLQDVSGKLDVLLAKYPDIALIPANMEMDVYDFDSNSGQVEKMVNEAVKLLNAHKVQDARYILSELVSEMRITTISIPLGTFPVAIKDAVSLIDKGKTDEAETALYDVLNMLVKTTEIMPLPVLRAEALLTSASELEHKSDLTKEASRTEILKLTDAAKDKLKLAEILGYGPKDDYKQLYDAIDDIKDVIHSEKSAVAWDKIKASLATLKNKIIHPGK